MSQYAARTGGGPGAEDGLRRWIAPGRTALVIVDMQTDFALPDGAMGRAGADLSATPAALAAAQRLADAARAAGVPVVFVGLMTAPEDDSTAWAERMRRLGADPDAALALCRAGTLGATFVGPIPLVGEPVVAKLRYSGFFRTDLDAQLQRLGVDTLVIAGLTTECCVDCTARDAFHLDYHVFVAGDACAAYEADVHAAALKALALHCAIVVAADAVVAAWAGG
ncbi:MAG TPA: isochorismatase family cysteine hydrolase [Caulobacteraceae bacterium]|jgi:nicotinamidase-related amidase|nr:isochorismatase family cysteine hydrolase [Caulobacteraceae bacterium]